MDAIKFIEERDRMCNSFGDECVGCPGFDTSGNEQCCSVGLQSKMSATAQIAIVEKWSTAHPIKTRQDVFMEQWPCAKVDDTGILCIYPCDLDKSEASGKNCDGFSCSDCRREFWMHEVE